MRRVVAAAGRGEVNRGLDDGLSKAFELAITPAICGALGWLVDQQLEVTPLFTIIAFLLGVVGTTISLWTRYDTSMKAQEAEAAAVRAARTPAPRWTAPVIEPAAALSQDPLPDDTLLPEYTLLPEDAAR